MEANPVKNASSLLLFSGHSELETGLLSSIKQLNTNMFTNLQTGRVIHFVLEYVKMSKLLLNADFMKKERETVMKVKNKTKIWGFCYLNSLCQ